MKQHFLVINVAACHDCNNCFIACKDEHVDNVWLPYTGAQPRHGHSWMNILATERGQYPRIDVAYLPKPCQHCQDAPCIAAHPECISRRDDGLVLIDPVKAQGVKNLAASCPYGAIFWNEEAEVAQKCTLCAHILDAADGLRQPRCAHSCPTNAIEYVHLEPAEMEARVAAEGLETLQPELATRPSVYYKNLYRFEKAFASGAILKGGDCAEGLSVTLTGPGGSATQLTDGFGEFKFDALNPGEYTLAVEGRELRSFRLERSLNLGDLAL